MAKESRLAHPRFKGIAPTSSSYSSAIEVTAPKLLVVSGQLPIDRDGNPVGGDSIEAQATQILENLKAICEERGVGMDRIVKMNYYAADINRFGEVRAVRERYLQAPYPAATTVEARVTGGHLLEVEMVVARD